MKIEWTYSDEVVEKAIDFVSKYENNAYVIKRLNSISTRNNTRLTKQGFWRALMMCFLTTQQRSGAGSRVTEFLKSDNELLLWEFCKSHESISRKAEEVLTVYGLRFTRRISIFIQQAVETVQSEWQHISDLLEELSENLSVKDAIEKERGASLYLQKIKGIGPKQSRNLIQSLGLSRYEIPLDSRIMKVLSTEFSFPVPLSAAALSDEKYYRFIEDGLHGLLRKARILPCIFDACAFASFEKEEV